MSGSTAADGGATARGSSPAAAGERRAGGLAASLPDGLVVSLRKLDRFRWAHKARLARAAGWRLRTHGADWLRFVLGAAELDEPSYAIGNPRELGRVVAEALDVPEEHVRGYMTEAELVPALTTQLRARLRFRPDVTRRPALGRRAAWYAVVRATKPALVLETGVGNGHGSLVLLAALRRNADEGHPGRLVSVDGNPAAGWLVPPDQRAGWEWVNGRSPRALPGAIGGRQVDLLVTATPVEDQAEELRHVLAATSEPVVVLAVDAGSGGAPGLRTVTDVPARHPGRGRTLALGRVAPS